MRSTRDDKAGLELKEALTFLVQKPSPRNNEGDRQCARRKQGAREEIVLKV